MLLLTACSSIKAETRARAKAFRRAVFFRSHSRTPPLASGELLAAEPEVGNRITQISISGWKSSPADAMASQPATASAASLDLAKLIAPSAAFRTIFDQLEESERRRAKPFASVLFPTT